ncbi:hypothetical protein [Nostoc sp. CHAB 5715]|uniref:hypothetical protein n=1 Tax=Nostoc sp. CHAB 5715 TaxID=2780400 RepID=UPI001E33BBC4|nr:hypothetical protein [Nostoc sp. CHAB 5715]MCC5621714.1 hypothetical protein [Nostoc sp. CHAB 5715]
MQIKLSNIYVLPVASMVALIGALLIEISTAQSSDFQPVNSALHNPEVSDEVIDRQVLQEGQVLIVQTRSKGVEVIAGAKVVTMTKSYIVTIQDKNGKVIRVLARLGGGSDLIATAVMSKAEALQLLESGGGIVENSKD